MSKDKAREFIDNWLNAAMVSDLLTFQEEHPNHAFIGPHVAQLTKDYIDTLEAKLAECVAALEYYAKSEGPSRVADGNLAGIVLAKVKK